MTTILIIEANTPKMVAQGNAGATGFITTFKNIAPHIECRIVNPYENTLTDQIYENIAGVIFTGSGVPWGVDAEEGKPQRFAMEAALRNQCKIWGSCNGMQLASVVLGGRIRTCPNGIEIGVAQKLSLTQSGASHPMMTGRRNEFSVPCVHRDELEILPKATTILASNEHTRAQALVMTSDGTEVWGTQYHPELAARDIAAYTRFEGIFKDFQHLANDLDYAESDADAASRLGTSPVDLQPESRATELRNWLTHINIPLLG